MASGYQCVSHSNETVRLRTLQSSRWKSGLKCRQPLGGHGRIKLRIKISLDSIWEALAALSTWDSCPRFPELLSSASLGSLQAKLQSDCHEGVAPSAKQAGRSTGRQRICRGTGRWHSQRRTGTIPLKKDVKSCDNGCTAHRTRAVEIHRLSGPVIETFLAIDEMPARAVGNTHGGIHANNAFFDNRILPGTLRRRKRMRRCITITTRRTDFQLMTASLQFKTQVSPLVHAVACHLHHLLSRVFVSRVFACHLHHLRLFVQDNEQITEFRPAVPVYLHTPISIVVPEVHTHCLAQCYIVA